MKRPKISIYYPPQLPDQEYPWVFAEFDLPGMKCTEARVTEAQALQAAEARIDEWASENGVTWEP